jgi:PIN domain nuclease of toxin-antitoxin system
VTVLIDTNVFLWCIAGEQRKLSRTALRVVEDMNVDLWLSSISLWEIAIKVNAGKLDLPKDPDFYKAQIAKFCIGRVLPVEEAHVLADFGLPRYHRDPFDRMLIAQAQVEGLPFVTGDKQIQKYPIHILW